MCVSSESQTKHTDTLHEQNLKFVNGKHRGTQTNHNTFKGLKSGMAWRGASAGKALPVATLVGPTFAELLYPTA
jgi:hypothetical protein